MGANMSDSLPVVPVIFRSHYDRDSLPVVPVIFRSHYDRDSRRRFVVAAFPTIAAESSDWYVMQGFDFGTSEHCAVHPQWFAKGRRATPEEVAECLPRLRKIWEPDPDFPCRLKPYQRVHGWMKAQRRKGGPK